MPTSNEKVEYWGRDHFECVGFDDEAGHHDCPTPHLGRGVGERCVRCNRLHRQAAGQEKEVDFMAEIDNRFAMPSANLHPGTPVEEPRRRGRPKTKLAEPSPTSAARIPTPPPPLVVTYESPPIEQQAPVEEKREEEPIAPEPVWELFTEPAAETAANTVPLVSLRTDGRLYLNKRAWENMGSPTTVEVFISMKPVAVALRPCPADWIHARTVKKAKGTQRWAVPIRAVLSAKKLRDIRPQSSRLVRWGDRYGMLLTREKGGGRTVQAG